MSLLKIAFKPLFARPLSTTNVLRDPRILAKMRKLQAEYQCEDGRPIWLKAGFRDRILWASTVISCYTGMLMVFSTLYDFAKPASWRAKPC